MYKAYSLIAFLALTPIFAVCQGRQITPTTPDAANFSKIANYPVDLNTGLPGISLPFFEVESGGMKLPIQLDYHAGGFKINEQSGSVGLGWALSTDIQITRTINGSDDFGINGYAFNNYAKPWSYNTQGADISEPSLIDKYALTVDSYDGKPDKFNYKLLNKSGAFYILRNGSSFSFVTTPYENIQISFYQHQFKMIDTDGTTYYFSLPILPADETSIAQTGREKSGTMNWDGSQCDNCVITTWKCMKIENPTKTDAFTFTYVQKPITRSVTGTDFMEYFNNPNVCDYQNTYYPNSTAVTSAINYPNLLANTSFWGLSSPKYMLYVDGLPKSFHMLWLNPAHSNQWEDKTLDIPYNSEPKKRASDVNMKGLALASITFRGGSVVFTGTDQVTAVTVNSQAGEVKTLKLFQSYKAPVFLTQAKSVNGDNFQGTMYLDSVHITTANNIYENYSFYYKNKFCFGNHLKGHDAWGYVNAKTCEAAGITNPNITPFFPPHDITQTYFFPNSCANSPATASIAGVGDEYPHEEFMQSGMLNRILYPTGGFVDFNFEGNRYAASSTDVLGTSQRSLLGGGVRIQKISYHDGGYYASRQKYYTYGEYENGDGFLLNPPPVQYIDGKQVYGNYSFNQTVYYGYSSAPGSAGPPASSNVPGFYAPCLDGSCVTLQAKEYKTTYLPNSALDLTYSGGAPIYYTRVTEYEADYGKETGKKVYTYYPVDYFRNFPSISPLITGIRNNTDEFNLQTNWYFGKAKTIEDYKIKLGKFVKIHEKSFEYTENLLPEWPSIYYSFLTNIFNIKQMNGIPVDIYFSNRPGMHGTTVESPDFNVGLSGMPIGNLLLSAEREKWISDDNTVINTATEYFYENSTYFQPTRIISYDSKGGYKAKILKYAYDFPADNVYTGMVSRNMISPVIEEIVKNSANEELARTRNNYAYTNAWFYAPSSVQTSLGGSPLEISTTFNKYDDFANIQSLTNKDGVEKCYLWGYQSLYPVAQVEGTSINNVINSGILQTVLDAPASNTQLVNEVNKLRDLNLARTSIKTFCYKPMVGLSDVVDERRKHAYYEYDITNRLQNIKDNELNVVKKFSYALNGPRGIGSFGMFYTNRPVMGTVCNCYTEPFTGPGNNWILKGGIYNSNSAKTADNYAIANLQSILGNGSASTICANDPSNLNAVITIHTVMDGPSTPYTGRPSNVQTDFFQNGSIVSTIRFPDTDNTFKTTYLAPGDYQLGISDDPFYRGRAIKYYVSTSDGYNYPLFTGNTLNVRSKVTYSITATTMF